MGIVYFVEKGNYTIINYSLFTLYVIVDITCSKDISNFTLLTLYCTSLDTISITLVLLFHFVLLQLASSV